MTNSFVKDPSAATTAPTASLSILDIFKSLLSGLESGIFTMVLSVVTVFLPQFASVSLDDLNIIGNNFRLFLVAIGGGTPWGQALADMLTANWNSVEESAKTLATDFAEAVATVLDTAGLLPQGK